MGVLDEAIREHLDLKRRRGASDEEISRAEAEALTPARRPAPPVADLDEDDHGDERTRVVEPVDDVAPPPRATHAVHDIDEDPMPAPTRGQDAAVDGATVESDTVDAPPPDAADREPGRLSE
ncbi:MAG: hypothetical protein QOI65_1311 [Thermoleophilaceae bacterium]|nr:hypothetical protein [Thermoleophilaceae bacterium]